MIRALLLILSLVLAIEAAKGDRAAARENGENNDEITGILSDDGTIVYAYDGSGEESCEAQNFPDRVPSKWTTDDLIEAAKSLVTVRSRKGQTLLLNCDDGPNQNNECKASSVGECDSDTQRASSLFATDETAVEGFRLIVGNGIPNHCYQPLEGSRIRPACEVASAILAPLTPRTTKPEEDDFEDTPMGVAGIAVSGAFIFNHKSAEECNVAAIMEAGAFDPCDGHSTGGCVYHYHKAPVCIPNYDNCGLLGYMLDGTALYGICEFQINGVSTRLRSCYRLVEGTVGCDADTDFEYVASDDCHLDQANGYFFEEDTTAANGVVFKANTYAYFATPEYPFVMPKFANAYEKNCPLPMNPDFER